MSAELFTFYWVLVAAGFVLIAAEIFIPGGIIGVLGVMAIIAAGILGFPVFGLKGGFFSALGLFVGATAFLTVWIKYCPQSFIGKWFTLQADGKEFKAFDESRQELVGKNGVAHSDLRPSGIALIAGQKIDVVSEAGFVPHGSPIKVIEAVGSRVVVRQLEAS